MTAVENKILIVDNEPELTDVLKIALETMGGFHVQSENDPSQAVAAAKQFAPDLILMDIKMPELDGADVAIQLRADPDLSETPIVFLSGAVSAPEIGRQGQRTGGLRFLPKTMRLDSMVACLRDIMHGTPVHRAA